MREQVTTTLRWTGDWPWYAAIGIAAALAITALMLYRRDTRGGASWLGVALPVLRALAVFLIVVMLAGPVLHHRKVVGELARLIVAIDDSESMTLTDSSMDTGRKVSIAQRLGLLENVAVALDLPNAAERLADARNVAAGIVALDAASSGDAFDKARAEFAGKVAEADALLEKGLKDKEMLNRFRAELAKPAKDLVSRSLNAIDERTRLATDAGRLGDIALRWSRDIGEVFAKQIDSDPGAASLKTALAKFDALPRWQRTQALLLEGKPEQRILAQLVKQHDVQVVTLENGAVKQLWQPGKQKQSEPPSSLPKPTGELTDLTSALKFAVGDENKAERGAVLIFTDGQHNSGESPLDTAKILAGRKMPVFTVGLGSQIPPRNLAIVRVVVPDAVFHEDRVRGEILMKEEVPAGVPFTLAVKDGDKIVWEKQLVSEGKPLRRVPFEFPVKQLAEARLKNQAATGYETLGAPVELKAVVSGFDGDREPSNNEAGLRFRAITQKRRILIVDGRPRWETRYLRNLFERDEKWEVNAVVAGSSNDAGFIRGEKPGTFPNDPKLLEAYNLIIFGEVPKTALRDEELKWIADFTGMRGGALLFIDGARGTLRQYADTPLGPLLPVEWPAGVQAIRGGIKSLALSDRAASLGAFALSTELAANPETWTKLPPPHWLSGAKPLPGAETLLEADTGNVKTAAAVMRPFGAGRVYYQAFDDSWRWRYEVGDTYHVKFWNQLASFVAEPPFAARDKFAQVDAGQLTYQPGESAALRVRLRDGEGKPVTDAAVHTVLFRGGTKVATIEMLPDPGGLYRGKTAALEPGDYEMAIDTAAVPEGQLKARTQFKVTPRESLERTMLSLNEDLLRRISVASGGEYFREERADEVIAKLAPLSSGTIIEGETVLWQSWPWFSVIVGLLTIEWIIRKRAGML